MSVSDLGEGRFLFWFYHVVDVDRITDGDDPLVIRLIFLNLWVHVCDLPFGFMSESVARQLGISWNQAVELGSTTEMDGQVVEKIGFWVKMVEAIKRSTQ
ncbi:hypothetical protein GQ457_04G015610 [Hibiscus cannabinus]